MNAQLQRPGHLLGRFGHAGKYGFRRVTTGGNHALQFAHGHDVKARAEPCQHIEYREVGVGLDRVANEVGPVGQGILIGLQRRFEGGA